MIVNPVAALDCFAFATPAPAACNQSPPERRDRLRSNAAAGTLRLPRLTGLRYLCERVIATHAAGGKVLASGSVAVGSPAAVSSSGSGSAGVSAGATTIVHVQFDTTTRPLREGEVGLAVLATAPLATGVGAGGGSDAVGSPKTHGHKRTATASALRGEGSSSGASLSAAVVASTGAERDAFTRAALTGLRAPLLGTHPGALGDSVPAAAQLPLPSVVTARVTNGRGQGGASEAGGFGFAMSGMQAVALAADLRVAARLVSGLTAGLG